MKVKYPSHLLSQHFESLRGLRALQELHNAQKTVQVFLNRTEAKKNTWVDCIASHSKSIVSNWGLAENRKDTLPPSQEAHSIGVPHEQSVERTEHHDELKLRCFKHYPVYRLEPNVPRPFPFEQIPVNPRHWNRTRVQWPSCLSLFASLLFCFYFVFADKKTTMW